MIVVGGGSGGCATLAGETGGGAGEGGGGGCRIASRTSRNRAMAWLQFSQKPSFTERESSGPPGPGDRADSVNVLGNSLRLGPPIAKGGESRQPKTGRQRRPGYPSLSKGLGAFALQKTAGAKRIFKLGFATYRSVENDSLKWGWG